MSKIIGLLTEDAEKEFIETINLVVKESHLRNGIKPWLDDLYNKIGDGFPGYEISSDDTCSGKPFTIRFAENDFEWEEEIMSTVRDYCREHGLTTTNTEDLDSEVIRVEETDTTDVRLYIAPGHYVIATFGEEG